MREIKRELKFRAWDEEKREWVYLPETGDIDLKQDYEAIEFDCLDHIRLMQYTGLKDKNGHGLLEAYEGDIIGKSSIVGNIYETDPRETDLVIPSITSENWLGAYKEAVARGFGYAKRYADQDEFRKLE